MLSSRNDGKVAPIIAFCGIDGSGKTTIVDRLRRDPRFRAASFVKKEQKEDFERLLRLAPPREPMPTAYFHGMFAQASRWAHALDFLRFYETVVRPLEPVAPLIVSDRWSFCTITFADIGTNLKAEIEFILRSVPGPALTFYLDVDPKVAIERLTRRGPLAHDEHAELLAAYRDAYERYFSTYRRPLVRVASSSPDEEYGIVLAALQEHRLIPVSINSQ